jgi:hypothetical protein
MLALLLCLPSRRGRVLQLALESLTMPADRHSWSKLTPLPEQRARLDFAGTFTPAEYERLCAGLIPEQMEDKWFIFAEDGTLFFHRSWTGHCIFELHLEAQGEGWGVAAAYASRDPGQYQSPGENYDLRLLDYLVEGVLLGRQAPLPLDSAGRGWMQRELQLQQSVGRGPREQGAALQPTLGGMLRWLVRWLAGMLRR